MAGLCVAGRGWLLLPHSGLDLTRLAFSFFSCPQIQSPTSKRGFSLRESGCLEASSFGNAIETEIFVPLHQNELFPHEKAIRVRFGFADAKKTKTPTSPNLTRCIFGSKIFAWSPHMFLPSNFFGPFLYFFIRFSFFFLLVAAPRDGTILRSFSVNCRKCTLKTVNCSE